jgi:hypothetical protein
MAGRADRSACPDPDADRRNRPGRGHGQAGVTHARRKEPSAIVFNLMLLAGECEGPEAQQDRRGARGRLAECAAMRTPPPASDIETVFPQLRGYARGTTLLHPTPGEPGIRDSSIGGPLWWPTDEEWPICQESFVDPGNPPTNRSLLPPSPLIPVVQLWIRDVPDLPHPAGAEVFQLLWVPSDYAMAYPSGQETAAPADEYFQVRWRRADDVVDVLADQPLGDPDDLDFDYTPVPCVLEPERTIEYPPSWFLGEEFYHHVRAVDEETGADYSTARSYAWGCKAGGWAGDTNVGGPYFDFFVCDCGTPLHTLLTLSSGENAHDIATTPTTYATTPWTESGVYTEPHEMYLGRGMFLNVFYCPASWDHPIRRYVM